MILYDDKYALNCRRVRIFLAEKGVELPLHRVRLIEGGARTPEVMRVAPNGMLPVLELDDGTAISESVAICRYIEALHPEPPLLGTGALGQALVEMWQRRMEFELLKPMQETYRHTDETARMLEPVQVPQWAALTKGRAEAGLAMLDARLAVSPYVAGDALSIADITGFCAASFGHFAKVPRAPEHVHLARWYAALAARPSFKA